MGFLVMGDTVSGSITRTHSSFHTEVGSGPDNRTRNPARGTYNWIVELGFFNLCWYTHPNHPFLPTALGPMSHGFVDPSPDADRGTRCRPPAKCIVRTSRCRFERRRDQPVFVLSRCGVAGRVGDSCQRKGVSCCKPPLHCPFKLVTG